MDYKNHISSVILAKLRKPLHVENKTEKKYQNINFSVSELD